VSYSGAIPLSESGLDQPAPPRLELGEWRAKYGVIAGITGADGGFDLGLWGRDPGERVLRNWTEFQSSFEPGFERFVVSRQKHGIDLARWEGGVQGLSIREGLDGHLTSEPGILLTVLVADCVPVYLLDPTSKAVALLHAGWRGIATGILSAGVEQLESAAGSIRDDLVMHCGISVCGACYEVGPVVIEELTGRRVSTAEMLDLRSVLTSQANRLGIRSVSVSTFCTVHDSGRFHSFRTRGEEAGRMAAYLGVPFA